MPVMASSYKCNFKRVAHGDLRCCFYIVLHPYICITGTPQHLNFKIGRMVEYDDL